MRSACATLVFAVALTSTGDLAAQHLRVSGAAALGTVTLRREITGTPTTLNGAGLGGWVRVAIWRADLEVRYLQSSLGDPGATEDLVEGEALLGVQFLPWLSVRAGPRIRALVTDLGTERWVMWEGRLRTHTHLVGRSVSAYAEAWSVLGGDTNLNEAFSQGQGIEGGLVVRLFGQVFGVLGYRFDRTAQVGGVRTDATEQLIVQLGIGGS